MMFLHFGHDHVLASYSLLTLNRILELDWRAGYGHSPWLLLLLVLVLAFDWAVYFVPAHTVLSLTLETRRSLSHALIHTGVFHKLRGHLAFFSRDVDRKWLA
jgi:hypothetical protein